MKVDEWALVDEATYPRANMMEYLFPLREGVTVRLVLPRDVTVAEVRRLERFMMALVVGEQEEAQA